MNINSGLTAMAAALSIALAGTAVAQTPQARRLNRRKVLPAPSKQSLRFRPETGTS